MGLASLFFVKMLALSLCPGLTNVFSPVVLVLCFSTFLSEQLSQDVAEMLLVVRREVEEDGSWLNSENPKK